MKKISVALLLFAACKTVVPAPPDHWVEAPAVAQEDAGDPNGHGTDLGSTCEALVDAGCPEGQPLPHETCYQHLSALAAVGIVPDVACILDAGSDAAGIRACGDPSSQLTFRCR